MDLDFVGVTLGGDAQFLVHGGQHATMERNKSTSIMTSTITTANCTNSTTRFSMAIFFDEEWTAFYGIDMVKINWIDT